MSNSGLPGGDQTQSEWNSNNPPSELLQRLYKKREEKRRDFQALFQRKRDLQQQLQAVDAEIHEVQDELFQMDDEIGEMEEATPPTPKSTSDSKFAANGIVNATPLSPLHITATQDTNEILSELPITSQPTQIPQEEQLTDPLTCTQAANGIGVLEDSDDDGHPPLNSLPSLLLQTTPKPIARGAQLILKPAHPTSTAKGTTNSSSGTNAASCKAPAPRTMYDYLQTPQRSVTTSGTPTTKTKTTTKSQLPSLEIPFSEQQIEQVLHQTFGINSFREHQLDIIQATLAALDCFVIMRTGGGKSLLYQLPVALELPKITLVISPLLSLIEDQLEQMNQFVPDVCVSFHSGLTKTQQAANWQRVRDPEHKVGMILVTPERVHKSQRLKSELQALYSNGRFARIVIDECHCCCQWGHDFRPDYAKLGVLRSTFPRVPILAVTATASDRVREDCCRILKLQSNYKFFRSTANRPNLTYIIERKEGSSVEILNAIAEFIQSKHANHAGIIYTFTRNDANTVAAELVERGIVAEAYHSDVSPAKKSTVHKNWMQNKCQVVVATIAFGLGINKPDVRFVLHHCISKTLEAYYQESGRAGRDGLPADCVLYYSPKDVPRMLRMVHGEQSQALVWTMIKYAQQFGSDAVCRTILLRNLGEPNQEGALQAALQVDQELPEITARDVLVHAQTVLQLLYSIQDDNVTLPMLVKEWRSTSDSVPECVQKNPPGKELSLFDCEYLIVSLMVQRLIACNVQYTAYDTVVYLRCTDKAEQFLISPRAQMTIRLPDKKPKAKVGSGRKSIGSTASSGNGSQWIERKTKKGKSTSSAATPGGKRKRAPSASSVTKSKKKIPSSAKGGKRSSSAPPARKRTLRKSAVSSKRTPIRDEPEVIDIDDSSEDEPLETLRTPRTNVTCARDDLMDDTEEEEFEG